MGVEIESTVVIKRPVEEVFAYVLDYENNGLEWAPDVKSVQKTSEGPVGAGTTFRQRQEVMGRQRDTLLRFTGVETNSKIEVEVDLGVATPRVSMVFDGAEGDTRVTVKGDLNPKGVFKVLSPIGRHQGQRMWDARLESLKSVLDAE